MRAKQGLNWSWNALMRILLNRFPQVRPQTRSKDSEIRRRPEFLGIIHYRFHQSFNANPV